MDEDSIRRDIVYVLSLNLQIVNRVGAGVRNDGNDLGQTFQRAKVLTRSQRVRPHKFVMVL